jgi:hypothetical protein
MSSPGYPNPLPVQAIIEHLADACHQDIHEFRVDEVSVLDSDVVDSSRIHGPRQLTDTYLLALAVQHKGRLVTFDTGIPAAAVRNATTQRLHSVSDTPEREPLPLRLPLMVNADGTTDHPLFADRLHPNDLGYARMWTVLSPLLVKDLQ